VYKARDTRLDRTVEEGLRRLVSSRRAALRSGPAPHRMPQNEATRRPAVDVSNSPDGRTSMEVVFEAAAGPGAWDAAGRHDFACRLERGDHGAAASASSAWR
jgi:hypothetical protein